MKKNYLVFLINALFFNLAKATDLLTLTPPQTFTVGQFHGNVNAVPGNSPHLSYADISSCASITPLGGSGSFVNPTNSPSLIVLSF